MPKPSRAREQAVEPCWCATKLTPTAAGIREISGSQRQLFGGLPMKVREVVRLLEQNGWVEMRSKGSHQHFRHLARPSLVTVPGNDGKELAPGTLNAILKKAGLK